MEDTFKLDGIAAPMRDAVRDFAGTIADIGGRTGKALTLFGAVTTESFDPNRQTARSVLVVDQVDLDMLRRLSEQGLRFGKSRIAAPLMMTPAYIDRSRDTFPLELIEISQRHVTVFGDECFDNLVFEDAHVRLQSERELKVILIGLRQGLLAAAGREKFLAALEMDMAEGLLRTLRGLLWLKGRRDPMPGQQVVAEIEKIADRRLGGVRTALDPNAPHDWAAFRALYDDVEALGRFADGS